MAFFSKAGMLLALCGASAMAMAQTPGILLEACNAMEPASRRLECLRAAAAGQRDPAAMPQGVVAPPRGSSTQRQSLSSMAPAPRAAAGQTCFTGPRGGTYTITASGRKNYAGC